MRPGSVVLGPRGSNFVSGWIAPVGIGMRKAVEGMAVAMEAETPL